MDIDIIHWKSSKHDLKKRKPPKSWMVNSYGNSAMFTSIIICINYEISPTKKLRPYSSTKIQDNCINICCIHLLGDYIFLLGHT